MKKTVLIALTIIGAALVTSQAKADVSVSISLGGPHFGTFKPPFFPTTEVVIASPRPVCPPREVVYAPPRQVVCPPRPVVCAPPRVVYVPAPVVCAPRVPCAQEVYGYDPRYYPQPQRWDSRRAPGRHEAYYDQRDRGYDAYRRGDVRDHAEYREQDYRWHR